MKAVEEMRYIYDLEAFSVVTKKLDTQMLLDTLEENQMTAQTVEIGDGERWQREVVGEKEKSLDGLGTLETDTTQRRGEALVQVEDGERDGLVADETGATVERSEYRRST